MAAVERGQPAPKITINDSFPQKLVGHHRTADMSLFCEVIDPRNISVEIRAAQIIQSIYFGCGQKKSSSHIVTKLFNSRPGGCATNASRTKPDMAEFMKQRECPSGYSILIVDHDKWRD